ncbi:MAG: hypothetical protein HY568_03630 [Candidatus Latescibacteria bacterium]|nr:hypothetical protein [Candidatus Latescibacterota bacterium]
MRTIVLSASLIAFSVACGYAKLLLFPYLFFVELFTVAVFLSGVLAGPGWGLWIGGVARLTFSLANPYGPPHPWILVAQTLGGALVGGLGGLARPWLLLAPERSAAFRKRIPILLSCGAAATLLYDALTNVAQGIVYGSLPAALALGIAPAVQHTASNLAIFGVAGEFAIPWLRRHPVAARRAE